MELLNTFLFILGIAQILYALVTVLRNENEKVQEHMNYYLGGVAVYFALLYILSIDLPFAALQSLHIHHLYGGAVLLSGYHLAILATEGRFFEVLKGRSDGVA